MVIVALQIDEVQEEAQHVKIEEAVHKVLQLNQPPSAPKVVVVVVVVLLLWLLLLYCWCC